MSRAPKHYGARPEQIITAPTKAEHDAQVAATGRPFTQPEWSKLGRKPPKLERAEMETL